MKMIGAPHGLQDGLIHPLAKYSSYCLLTSADSAEVTADSFDTNVFSEVQHWGGVQYGAQYPYPQACLVDQRYHGIQ